MIHRKTKKEDILKLTAECSCERCRNGCRFGSGFLADEDIRRMADFLKIPEQELKEKYLEELEKFHTKRYRPKLVKKDLPFGKCVFFREEKCSVHDAKPLECRIAMGCKDYGEDLIVWFTLNYFVNPKDPHSVREWAVYLDSGGKNIPGGELGELVPDRNELREILSYRKTGYEKDWEKVLGIKSKGK